MTINEFVDKAHEGGWSIFHAQHKEVGSIFLDPLAWQAVGKMEGWNGFVRVTVDAPIKPRWLANKHRMIDALAEGKTIEEFLTLL